MKFRALLATARIANVPSVVSNVWLGIALGSLDGDRGFHEIPATIVLCLILAGISVYVAGNFLNDWMDRDWDQQHRPERALPRRLFTRDQYAWVAGILMALALLLAGWVSWLSGLMMVAIIISICIYTATHKRTPWSVIPMAICRALLPALGYSAFLLNTTSVSFAAAGLLCYIMGLSLNARYESITEPPKSAVIIARSQLVLTAVLLFFAAGSLNYFPVVSIVGLIPFCLWMRVCLTCRRRPISRFVSSLLAGIPLVDWMILLPISLSLILSNAALDGSIIGCLLIPPLAFILALLLQKYSPAT